MSTNLMVNDPTPPPPRHRELRVGQIYQERHGPRRVQIVMLRADNSVVIQRINGPERSLGRRTVRKISSFHAAFDFYLEEIIDSFCPRCEKRIKSYHYADRVKSDHSGPNGLCWDCFSSGK